MTTNQIESKKKYLVILAGSPRGGLKTWKSLFKYVVNHLNADLAICTTDNYIGKNILFENANYKWIMENPDNFEQYYYDNFEGNWKEYLLKGKELGLYESGLIHFVFKDFIYKNFKDILTQYEYIIYSRFDQYYTDYHPKFSEDFIYIPEGEDYFGICDRHVAFKSNKAKEYFSIIDYINSKKAIDEIPKFPNCESVYKQHLMAKGLLTYVKRHKRVSFTAALQGDSTNWRVPEYKVFLSNGLSIKYPDEFLQAMKNKYSNNLFLLNFINDFPLNIYYLFLIFKINLSAILKKEKKLICEQHGKYFLSQRYNKLSTCPQCENLNELEISEI